MIRLGLFGGTFDPVHYGHLRTVEAARIELNLPKIILLPNPTPPHKNHISVTPYPHRKAMLALALAEFPNLEIGNYEENMEGPAYTTDTIRRVLASLPNQEGEIWLVIGADSLLDLPQWKNPEDLFQTSRVAVLPRPGFDMSKVEERFSSRIYLLKTPLIPVSATEIRKKLSNSEEVSEWIPVSVLDYIRQNGLYQKS